MSHNELADATDSANGIPAALMPLADRPIWVGWKKVQNLGEKKARKVPVDPATGKAAKVNDPSTWGNASAALAAVPRYGLCGVGIVLTDLGDGRRLVGKDIDLGRSPVTGEIMPWGREQIASWNTYGEVSPSGTGVKLLGYVTRPLDVPVKEITVDAPIPEGAEGSDHDKPEIGLYPGSRYFTVTGERLDGCPDQLADVTEAADADAARMAGRPAGARMASAKAKVEIDRAKLPERVVEILDTDARLRGAYESGEKPTRDGKDGSDSAFDFSTARYMAAEGYDDEDIELMVRHCPFGQFGRGKLNGTNAERRMERLLREAGKVREKGAKAAATVAMLAERHVYELSIRRHHDMATGEDIDPVAFNEKWAHEVDAAHAKLMKLETMVKADRSDYLPGEPGLTVTEGGTVILNRHRPSDLVPAVGDHLPFLRHIEWLIQDPVSREHFLNVLAFQLQNPGQKIGHMILLVGTYGNGKSIIRQLLALIVGARNLRKLPGSYLSRDNQYKRKLGNCRILWLEELMQPGRMEVANELKEWITEEKVEAQEKFVASVEVRTPYLIVAITNHDSALYTEAGDRRPCVIATNPEPKPEEYYVELMRKDLLRERAAAFAHHLLDRDVSAFNPHAPPPMTEAKETMIKGSRSALADLIEELMEGDMAKAVMTTAEVKELLADRGAFRSGKDHGRTVTDALKTLGWWSAGTVRIGGTGRATWVSPNAPELHRAADADISARYEEERSGEIAAKLKALEAEASFLRTKAKFMRVA